MKIVDVVALLYFGVAVVTYGAASQSAQRPGGFCHREEKPESCAYIFAGSMAAMGWPFYWSVRLWS